MKYLLDTNVVSESRKLGTDRIDPNVRDWLTAIDSDDAALSAITIFELELGILQIERRDALQGATLRRWMTDKVLPAFEGRILPITAPIAIRCADLHVPDPRSDRDSWIAATALEQNLIVVTRNVGDFTRTGVALLNPWEGALG